MFRLTILKASSYFLFFLYSSHPIIDLINSPIKICSTFPVQRPTEQRYIKKNKIKSFDCDILLAIYVAHCIVPYSTLRSMNLFTRRNRSGGRKTDCQTLSNVCLGSRSLLSFTKFTHVWLSFYSCTLYLKCSIRFQKLISLGRIY